MRCALASPLVPINLPVNSSRRCVACALKDGQEKSWWAPKDGFTCVELPRREGVAACQCGGLYDPGEVIHPISTSIEEHKEDEVDFASVYNIEGWGAPYFLANKKGNVAVCPLGEAGPEWDTIELIDHLESKFGMKLPLVLRFPDILLHRMKQLQECFDGAIQRFEYGGSYQPVFPVKCNHDRGLLVDLMEGGKANHTGLEVGSRPELLIAISLFPLASSRSVVICNGFKDQTYIQTAFEACALGMNVAIVLEHPEELVHVLKLSSKYEAIPTLGVRARLNAKHNGHWGSTSGEKSKFGLGPVEILSVVERLRREGLLPKLKLLHFHMGSQIPTIALIKEAMREASHIYSELFRLGAPMGLIDVGGGLAIDYDGQNSDFGGSINYNMQNYANDIVAALQDVCLQRSIPPPLIFSESGRALASHHSILVFDAKGPKSTRVSFDGFGMLDLSDDGNPSHFLLKNFEEVYKGIAPDNIQESFNDAQQFVGEARSLFKLGMMSLEERAYAESLFDACCAAVTAEISLDSSKGPEELLSALSGQKPVWYHANLSIFRSAPDAWALQQVFPVMPLQRLNERPDSLAALADLTCDSDGKLDCFAGGAHSLPVHSPIPGNKYILGLFLGGVYQEVLGSNHNMFGSTNVAHIALTEQGYYVKRIIRGQNIGEVLSTCQHYPQDMLAAFEAIAERAVSQGKVDSHQAAKLVRHLSSALDSYTYLS